MISGRHTNTTTINMMILYTFVVKRKPWSFARKTCNYLIQKHHLLNSMKMGCHYDNICWLLEMNNKNRTHKQAINLVSLSLCVGEKGTEGKSEFKGMKQLKGLTKKLSI